MKRHSKVTAFCTIGLLSFLLAEPTRARVFPIATNAASTEIVGGVSFDGTNYVVGLVSGANLVAQRVSTNGQLVGTPTSIGSNPGFPPAAAVANGKTQSLVAWSDTSLLAGVTMFGQLYSGSGLVGAKFPLLSTAGTHGFQAVQAAASDGTNYLVIWKDNPNNAFYGQWVTGAGTLWGSEFYLFGGGGNRNVAVTFGKTNYLVVWQQSSDNNTYGATIAPGGGVQTSFQVNSTASLDNNPVAVAFDGTNYLVVWNCDTNYSNGGWPLWKLCGRLVSQSGTVLGNELVLVTEQASFPALAFDGNNYLLAWGYNTGTTNTDKSIHAMFLDRSANPLGPILTPFPAQGAYPPLLPLNGVFSDGSRSVIAATYGSFVLNGMGDVTGFLGGDVYGTFLPRSTTPPAFTNSSIADGQFQGQLRAVPGQTYTIEVSTNLVSWTPVGLVSSDSTDFIPLADERGVTIASRMFYRAVAGDTLGASGQFLFLEFANGGGFGGGFTPTPSFPVRLDSYSAALNMENDRSYPAASNIFFTGPAGSGLSHVAANPDNSNISTSEAFYQSPTVSSPAAAPGGTWVVNYKGSNITYTVPEPQAASRLVVPLPTISVSGDVLQSVSWAYKDATTGMPLSGAPAYVTSVQVQMDGLGGRLYNSPDLAPALTSHVLSSAVNWSTVRQVHMTYNDSLGNHYVVSFSKP